MGHRDDPVEVIDKGHTINYEVIIRIAKKIVLIHGVTIQVTKKQHLFINDATATRVVSKHCYNSSSGYIADIGLLDLKDEMTLKSRGPIPLYYFYDSLYGIYGIGTLKPFSFHLEQDTRMPSRE